MYCRKCLRKDKKKINMDVDPEGQFYLCPECSHIINWKNEEEENEK